MKPLFGALEAGGTKFVCGVGTGPDNIIDTVRIPTTTPVETLKRTVEYFQEMKAKHGALAALGVGSFGPLDLDPSSPTWGFVTKTPKVGWGQTSLGAFLQNELGLRVFMDTDVNAAALGESLWGAGQGLQNLVYVTVGTGIGGGVMSGGWLVHGLVHPELGHMPISRRLDDPFDGTCPFHHPCLEGLASGFAMEKRWGMPGGELPLDHPAWELEAHYLALGVQNWILTLSPQKIILGGGVMEHPGLLPLVRTKVLTLLGGYVDHHFLTPEGIGEYLVAPGLGSQAGLAGALALALKGQKEI